MFDLGSMTAAVNELVAEVKKLNTTMEELITVNAAILKEAEKTRAALRSREA